MTAPHAQPRIRRERRIIERPRLIKLLDECEARIILLLAPAGYGKTTLARQWAKTLNGAIWISCTPAHRDVAVLAEDLGRCLDQGDGEMTRLVREFVAAHANPQLVGRSDRRAPDRPRFSNRYSLVADRRLPRAGRVDRAEDFVDTFQQDANRRFMIASRQRPAWATSKRVLYGEVQENCNASVGDGRGESSDLLGRPLESKILAEQAEGWPAVIALAAAADFELAPVGALPSALHDYFAEELFQRASPDLQGRLIDLSLLPRVPEVIRKE